LTKLNYSDALRITQLYAISYKHQYVLPSKGAVMALSVHHMKLLERSDRSTTSVRKFGYGKTPTGFSAGSRARV